MKIIKTNPGDTNFHLFEDLPKEIYPIDCPWTETRINEDYLKSCYVLLANKKPKARLAVYQNPELSYQKKPIVCIGNYECVNNINYAETLLTEIEKDVKSLGAKMIIGPMNGSTWDDYRFSTNRYENHFILEPYHHLYYNDQFKKSGFLAIQKYFSSIDRKLQMDTPPILKREQELLDQGMSIREIDLLNFNNELKQLYPFIKNAFKQNFLYSNITWDYFKNKYGKIHQLIDPKFVLLAEDLDKNIIGVFFCIIDLFNTKEKSLVIKTIARDPQKKWKGLGSVLGNQVYRNAKVHGVKSIIHAFMKEEGMSVQLSKTYSGKISKHYSLYGKEIK